MGGQKKSAAKPATVSTSPSGMRRSRLTLLGALLTQLISAEAAAPFKSQYAASTRNDLTTAIASLTPEGLEPSSPPPSPPRLIVDDVSVMGNLIYGMPELLMPDDPGSTHATQLLVRPAARQANTREAAAIAPGGGTRGGGCGAGRAVGGATDRCMQYGSTFFLQTIYTCVFGRILYTAVREPTASPPRRGRIL